MGYPNGKSSSRYMIVSFEEYVRQLNDSLQAKINANIKVNASVLSKIPVVHDTTEN